MPRRRPPTWSSPTPTPSTRAKAAGASFVIDIKDEDYGGRGFTCRDPEGHLWNVGTYDPWEAEPA